jgi:hypothetical protein
MSVKLFVVLDMEMEMKMEMEGTPVSTETAGHRGIKIVGSSEFSISLRAYMDAVKSRYHLCINDDRNQLLRERIMTKEKIPYINRLSFHTISIMF